jgi:hypothetical protein
LRGARWDTPYPSGLANIIYTAAMLVSRLRPAHSSGVFLCGLRIPEPGNTCNRGWLSGLPFYGGYGLLTSQGVAKPAYRLRAISMLIESLG